MNDCKVGPRFPSWLQNLKNLSSLAMPNASIVDALPLWFWNFSLAIERIFLSDNEIKGKLPEVSSKLPNLEILDLSHNYLEGQLPRFSSKLPNLEILDLSHNYLEGQLPQFSSNLVDSDQAHGLFSRSTFSNTSIIVPSLYELYVSSNKITGSIPSSLCELNKLGILDISKNMIEGVVPDCWNHYLEIQIMDLSYNNLHGIIPASICSTFLLVLRLSNNEFFGELPSSLKNCTSLETLDLEHNKISGSIPAWLGENLRRLRTLELRYNMLTGTIPPQLGNLSYLHIIDVSNNHLSGAIPHSFGNLTAMKTNIESGWLSIDNYVNNIEINMKGREFQLEGRIPSIFICIDLSNNMFSGEIPDELAHLSFLQSLNLSRNQLSGQLSKKFAKLRWLEVLDLSMNNLSGVIPPTMANLTSLNHLNLSYNNFYGEIPYGGQFQVLLDPSIYFSNRGLCGVPLNTKCEIEAPAQPPRLPNNEDDNNLEAIWFYLSMSLGFIFGFWAISGALILKKSWSFNDGDWITKRWKAQCGSQNLKAILASCAWLIWRAMCDKVFKNEEPNWDGIGQQAVKMVEDIVRDQKYNSGKLSHLPFHSSLNLFTDAAWTENDGCCGTGFALIDDNNTFVLAGASNSMAETSTHAEILALEEALKRCIEWSLYPHQIFTNCTSLVDMIYKEDFTVTWRFSEQLKRIRSLLNLCGDVQVVFIPRNLNQVADAVAKFALINPSVSLFH